MMRPSMYDWLAILIVVLLILILLAATGHLRV